MTAPAAEPGQTVVARRCTLNVAATISAATTHRLRSGPSIWSLNASPATAPFYGCTVAQGWSECTMGAPRAGFFTTLALVVLHVGAALWNQFRSETNVADRMPPFRKSERSPPVAG